MADFLGFLGGLLDTMIGAQSAYEANQRAEESNQIAKDTLEWNKKIGLDTLNWNKQNALDTLNWNKEQFAQTMDYNRWLNQTQMEREDTAIQRRMADLQAAGLNPLLAAQGQGASSSAGSSLSSHEMSVPEVTPPEVNFGGYNKGNVYKTAFSDAWRTAIQNAAEFHTMSKTDKEGKLIDAQTEGQEIQNGRDSDTWTFESRERINKLELQLADLQIANQNLENLIKEGKGKDLGNTAQQLKNAEQETLNQIRKEELIIAQNEAKVSTHDTNVYMNTPLTSAVVDKGAQTAIGQAAQDLMYSFGYGGQAQLANDALATQHFNSGNVQDTQTSESVPHVSDTALKENGYQDNGSNFYDKGKRITFYRAGHGVRYDADGTIWYGGKRLKKNIGQSALDFIQENGYAYPGWLE